MLEYLDACLPGAELESRTLDGVILKRESGKWSFEDDDRRLTSREIVEMMRVCIGEDGSGRDADQVFVCIEPVDKVIIKREMAEEGEEGQADPLPQRVGCTLAEIDLTGDGAPTEVATYDGGPVPLPAHVQARFDPYQLPLHLRLPPQEEAGTPQEEEDSEDELFLLGGGTGWFTHAHRRCRDRRR